MSTHFFFLELFSWNTFQGNMFYKNMHKLPKRWKEKKAAATNQWAEEKKKCLKSWFYNEKFTQPPSGQIDGFSRWFFVIWLLMCE